MFDQFSITIGWGLFGWMLVVGIIGSCLATINKLIGPEATVGIAVLLVGSAILSTYCRYLYATYGCKGGEDAIN